VKYGGSNAAFVEVMLVCYMRKRNSITVDYKVVNNLDG
jgi:hypothetical protein